jgi:hypothetical protein
MRLIIWEMLPLASIKLKPNNARAKLARSIEKFGFITPHNGSSSRVVGVSCVVTRYGQRA